MSPHPDDLTALKDDMTAFIEGLGMRRFFGYVEAEEIPSVLWDSGHNPDGWKDFVELAKSAGAGFLQLGWAHQGCMFVYEAGTEWYDHYQRLRELSDDVGGFMIDEPDQDDE